tara:strand:+ start:1654 stop:2034 length:381 start_codon:yes stop_codon:yes gene_type:complete
MVRGSNGTSGFNQLRDKSAYYKDYYARNKERLKRQRIRRLADRKQQNAWLKSHGVVLLNDPEIIKEQNKLEREKVRNYRRIRYQSTKEYYINYYQKNKAKIKAQRDLKKSQSNLTGADAYAIGGDS